MALRPSSVALTRSWNAAPALEFSHARTQADARLLGLRSHPSADGRTRQARGHRSRHSSAAAPPGIPAHAGSPGIPGLRAVARLLYGVEGARRLPVRGDPGGALLD